jgi:trk system potassium uptake protein
MSPNSLIVGKPLGETHIKSKYGVTVMAYRNGPEAWLSADSSTVLTADDTILVAGSIKKAEEFGQLR